MSRTRWIYQIRKDVLMRGENWEEIQGNTQSGRIETAGVFSVIVNFGNDLRMMICVFNYILRFDYFIFTDIYLP